MFKVDAYNDTVDDASVRVILYARLDIVGGEDA
jgi:hypothetical protein